VWAGLAGGRRIIRAAVSHAYQVPRTGTGANGSGLIYRFANQSGSRQLEMPEIASPILQATQSL
jgi:hypothetical protein